MVVSTHTTPRSYIIKTSDGTELKRNRRHLRLTNDEIIMNSTYIDDEDDVVCNNEISQNTDILDCHDGTVPITTTSETISRYGRIIQRYRDQEL